MCCSGHKCICGVAGSFAAGQFYVLVPVCALRCVLIVPCAPPHVLTAFLTGTLSSSQVCATRKDLVYWANQSSTLGALEHSDGGIGSDIETVKLFFYRAKVLGAVGREGAVGWHCEGVKGPYC